MKKLSLIEKLQIFFLVFILIAFLLTITGCRNINNKSKISSDAAEIAVTNNTDDQKEEEQTNTTASGRDDLVDKKTNNNENNEIIIGVEYVFPGLAKDFAETGIEAAKPFPEAIMWEKMQKSAESPIDFSTADRFVKEYQEAEIETIFITLRSRSNWASKDYNANPSPKEEYVSLYETWVSSVAERYDRDGIDDMPGLLRPVIYFEIGSEFSSYEPEPVEDYIDMLKTAYNAIHAASENSIVLHAPFLTTTAFKDNPEPQDYEKAFAKVDKRIMFHSLKEIRIILDNNEIFDVINIHSIGNPLEIEGNIKWLNYEMDLRGYNKPIIISDTAVNPFMGWGPATNPERKIPKPGIIIPPATEDDRFRLAEYFNKLIDGDEEYLKWVRAYGAADIAKMVTVAAEQNVALINTAFTEDFELAQTELFGAAAGNTSWSGMTKVKMNFTEDKHEVVKRYPSFYALKQIAGYLKDYDSIERISFEDKSLRIYKVTDENGYFFIAWFEPGYLVLPEDEIPESKLKLDVQSEKAAVENLITEIGQQNPIKETQITSNGILEMDLTSTPVFIFPQSYFE
ncbi:MAG: hypothetical protein M1308_04465 [Actinobacteria bacterium]|nr:hypothetical protein [Actinomycetota bacterium]MCL5070136.1 hypothetical protein [Actinomycetota bacterium]